MDCCKTNLGKFPHNQNIDTGLVATQAGTHEFQFSAANFTELSYKKYFGIGDKIIIPKKVLNEDFVYSFVIKQPDGVTFKQDVDGVPCENFILRTYVSTNNNCDEYICNY